MSQFQTPLASLCGDLRILSFTANQQGAAAKQAADNKTTKYQELEKTFTFFPVAIETASSQSLQATELVQEIGRCISAITGDNRETVFLFQTEAVRGPEKRKCGLILRHFSARLIHRCSH